MAELLQIRVIAPDSWSESRLECAPHTTLREVKERALPLLLRKSDADPAAFYVEYSEKEVLDESRTLAELDVPQGGVISIRPYDVDHPAPFSG
jgi:hypothetical protein